MNKILKQLSDNNNDNQYEGLQKVIGNTVRELARHYQQNKIEMELIRQSLINQMAISSNYRDNKEIQMYIQGVSDFISFYESCLHELEKENKLEEQG